MESLGRLGVSRQINVLVVDDDPDYHLMLEDVLDETGLDFTATFIDSVQAATDIIDDGQKFDVILVDYLLRPNTAFDLFTYIKNRNLRVPCIVLTNHDSPELDQQAVNAGVADLIAKRDLKAGILKRSILYAIRDSQQQAQLEYLAHYDPLTNLVNRSLFFDRLRTACTYANRDPDYQFAVLYLDLDFFKTINDSYGHAIGDAVLEKFSQMLKAHLRESDTAARLSGDEFAVLLHGATPPVAHMMAQKLLRRVEEPIWIGDTKIKIGVSIGIATTKVSGIDGKKLMSDADCALYAAKRSGRQAYFHFNSNRNNELRDQIVLEKDLQAAIKESQFELFYQPQFATRSGDLVGYETLVRWRHPEKGVIPPIQFLDSLHRIGCDKAFTDITLAVFFKNLSRLSDHIKDAKVALNLIPHQCLDPVFKKSMWNYFHEYGVDPANVRVEITEHHLMNQLDQLMEPLSFLRNLGVQVALDDFGEKYSSLNVLASLPVDVIKIDKLFVQKAAYDDKVACILEAITRITKGLDLISIAEGIENEQQYRVVSALGCDEYQGYWAGKPIEFAELYAELENSSDRVDSTQHKPKTG